MSRTGHRSSGFYVALALAWLTAVFLVAPNVAVVLASFTSKSFISFPGLEDFSVRHYRSLDDASWISAAVTSATIAAATSLLAGIFGTAAAIGVWRTAPSIATACRFVITAPIVLPPVIIGLALYRPWIEVHLFDTWQGLVIAHTILATPFVFVPVAASLNAIGPVLDDAARSMGASLLQRLFRILLPNLVPGIAGGLTMAFVVSWDEIVINLFVTQRKMITFPKFMYEGIRDNLDPVIVAAASVVIVATGLVLLVRAASVRHGQ